MNTSYSSPDKCYPGMAILPIVFMTAGFLIACLNVCCCVAMTISKTISENVRRPLMILCVSDVFFGTAIILLGIPDLNTSTGLCYSVRFIFAFYGTLTSTVIFLLSVDRYAILYFETSYMKYATSDRVRVVYVIVWIITPIMTYIRMGKPQVSSTTFQTLTRSSREVVFASSSMCFRILTLLFSAGTLLKIHVIQNRMPFVRGEFRRTTKLLSILCIYQGMLIPTTIYRLMWVTRPDLADLLGPIRQLSTLIVSLTGFLNPILYMFNFTECRLSMLQIICFWNKQMTDRIKYKKKQLVAPFLDTNITRPQQNPRVSDLPHSVGVPKLTSGLELPKIERNPQNRRLSVSDVRFTIPKLQQ